MLATNGGPWPSATLCSIPPVTLIGEMGGSPSIKQSSPVRCEAVEHRTGQPVQAAKNIDGTAQGASCISPAQPAAADAPPPNTGQRNKCYHRIEPQRTNVYQALQTKFWYVYIWYHTNGHTMLGFLAFPVDPLLPAGNAWDIIPTTTAPPSPPHNCTSRSTTVPPTCLVRAS